jgi:hypothetical protein
VFGFGYKIFFGRKIPKLKNEKFIIIGKIAGCGH